MPDEQKIDELLDSLTKLNKKVDKILKLNTTIAKSLHLLPVTEKEERLIQIQQRKNLKQATKVNNDLNYMENVEDEDSTSNLENIFTSKKDIYNDILGDDYLGD